MALSKAATDTLTNENDKEPNHIIFWLDAHIGNPKANVHLKKAFGSNTDPREQTWIMLTDKEFDKMTRERDAVPVRFEGVRFLLRAFDNEDDCLQAFENNQDKRIFFITSGSMGRDAVPKILDRYPRVFTDPMSNQPYASVYVYCRDIEIQMDWIMDHYEYVQAFNFDKDLLERLTRDIAEYFIERSQRLRIDNKLKNGLRRLHWAKKLWNQYDKMQQDISTDDLKAPRETKRMKEINQLIGEMESEKKISFNAEDTDSDDSSKGCEEAS